MGPIKNKKLLKQTSIMIKLELKCFGSKRWKLILFRSYHLLKSVGDTLADVDMSPVVVGGLLLS
jgi:hypothetical protein